jgi:hypothetical protein
MRSEPPRPSSDEDMIEKQRALAESASSWIVGHPETDQKTGF